MTLLDEQPRSASASAEIDSSLFFIPRAPLVDLMKRTPDLMVTLVREISDRLRDFNHQYVDKMIQAERMSLVGRFASSIIHDLKNPLTIIAMAARTAGLEKTSLEARQLAEQRINQQVDRITNLVNEILEFVRGAPASVALCKTHYGDFLDATCRELKPELEAKLATVVREGDAPDLHLQLNPKRLQRVLINLFDNAIDAMPNGGKIKVRCKREGQNLTTEVEDEGPGVPPEHQSKLFEAFATFGKAKGTGLGLAICQRIVEEHGGRISVRNGENGGALFTYVLPIPPQ
jgi:signal transduction histidine kinase